MDQRYVSLSRTGYRVALLAGCVLLAPSAARAAPPHDVPGPVTVNSTSGNTVANWSAFLDEAGVSACAGPQVQARMAVTMNNRRLRRPHRHRSTVASDCLPR